MARTPMIARDDVPSPAMLARDLPALVFVDDDDRVKDVQRRWQQACALVEAAESHAKEKRSDPEASALERLQAEDTLRQAERERDAVAAEAKAVRNTVLAESRAALTPELKAVVLARHRRLEQVAREENAAVLRILDEWMCVTGSAHPRAADLVLPLFNGLGGGESQLEFYGRYLATELGWTA